MDARGVTGDRSLMGNGRISATLSIQLFLRGDSYPGCLLPTGLGDIPESVMKMKVL